MMIGVRAAGAAAAKSAISAQRVIGDPYTFPRGGLSRRGGCEEIARVPNDPNPEDPGAYRSLKPLPSATSFSSSGAGLNWSPMVAWNSFILARIFGRPTWSPYHMGPPR